jgi:Glycosyltransferase family 92
MIVSAFMFSGTAKNVLMTTKTRIGTDDLMDKPSIDDRTRPGRSSRTMSKCYQELEVKKNRWIDHWLEADVPILDTVLEISEQVYQISLITKHLNMHQKAYWSSNITWYCNSMDNPGRLLVQNTPVHLVECTVPPGGASSLERLWPSKPSLKTNEMVHYEESCLGHFIECDRLEMKEMPMHLRHTATPKTKMLGACIIERQLDVSQLAQWIGYHQLMGMDHFWVYQNEKSRSLPEGDHVTYLPYNFVWEDHSNHSSLYRRPPRDIFWQEAMQLRCIYHAKRLGMEWITTIDVDEYIWVNVTDYHQHDFPLKRYLLEHHDEFDNVAGLTMNSISFGRHNDEPPPTANVSQPLMNYVWRPATSKWQRFKQIYHVPNVLVPEVHSVKGKGGSLQLHDVYLHHYKTPWKGVFKSAQRTVVKDTRLRDLYYDRVILPSKAASTTTMTL